MQNAFLSYFLNSRIGSEQVAARAQGTTRLRINVGNLKTIFVPILPLETQAELVQQLQTIESAATEVEKSLQANEATLTAFLNTIFGG